MLEVSQRRVAMKIAESLLWTPYKWGGDDPMEGVDCSGYWMEILWSLGIIPVGDDYPAAALFDLFPESYMPMEGDMVFWKDSSGKIAHIEMVYNLDLGLSIGASGGGSSTDSPGTASQHNAYVKIRPYLHRSREIAGYRNPYGEVT